MITEDPPHYSSHGKGGEHLMIEKALHNFEGDKTREARFIGWTPSAAEKMQIWAPTETLFWDREGWREAA